MKAMTVSLNDKMIAYTEQNYFRIEVGYGKSRYRLHQVIQGDLPRAVMLYNMINTGNGHKKRLICRDFNKPTIAKYVSDYERRQPKFLP